MKSLALSFMLFLICSSSIAQNQIQSIREHFKYVNDNISSMRIEKSKTFDESTDGAEITKYFNEERCVKIRLEYFGETGKLFREYYVSNDELLFVFDQEYNYNMPYYMDSVRAAQSGFDQWFDPSKTNLLESRFYFDNDKMIRWINPSGKHILKGAEGWLDKESFYIEDLKARLK